MNPAAPVTTARTARTLPAGPYCGGVQEADVGTPHLGSRVLRRRDDVLWRHTLSGALLLPADRAEPLIVDERGALIWDLLAESKTLDKLVDLLAERYSGDRTDIKRDTDTFLRELARSGLVERSPGV